MPRNNYNLRSKSLRFERGILPGKPANHPDNAPGQPRIPTHNPNNNPDIDIPADSPPHPILPGRLNGNSTTDAPPPNKSKKKRNKNR